FRSLRDVEVRLAPLNVLVGPNGAGKSNLLDVIAFLGDATRDDLEPALERRGGFSRVHFRGDPDATSSITIEVETGVSGESEAADTYALAFTSVRSPARADRRVLQRTESFVFTQGDGTQRRITIDGGKINFHGAGDGDTTVSLREDSLGLSLLPKLNPES